MAYRKPTALKELEGTDREDRGNALEPRLKPQLPDRPAWVDDDNRTAKLFDQITEYVDEMKISTRVDGIALGLLADQLDIYLTLRKDIRDNGPVLKVANKYQGDTVKTNPAMAQINAAYTNIFRMLKEFGLTPVSRASVNTIKEEDKDDFKSFLEGN